MTRTLETIFYGLACFDRDGDNYRVLFPDGRNPAPFNVPRHSCYVSIRPKGLPVTTNWPFSHKDNNFRIPKRRHLFISGLQGKGMDDTKLVKRLPNLINADKAYALDPNPRAIIEMVVDRGVLTSHRQKPPQGHDPKEGMIVVRWEVEAEDDATIMYGPYRIVVPATATQVILSNISNKTFADRNETQSDFVLFRMLAKQKTGPLDVVGPDLSPGKHIDILDPIDGKELTARCPFKDCSVVFSH